MKLLILAAHPDDAEISIGGTMLTQAEKGDEVYLLNFTNGEPTPNGTVETRLREAEEADRILKLQRRIIMDLPNRYLQDTIENRQAVAEHIRQIRPEVMLVQTQLDQHPDHIAASQLGTAARFYAKLTKTGMRGEPYYPPKILYYFTSHFKIDPSPSFVLPLSEEVFQKKVRAVSAYHSQFQHKNRDIPEFLSIMGKRYGSRISSPYGEPFYTPEVLGIQGLENIL
ncbi:MAG: PIG-L family deacetylase [Bacteroidales bacterium]|nr:PIG-L family deacetylase [Bacteroidales bacterium]